MAKALHEQVALRSGARPLSSRLRHKAGGRSDGALSTTADWSKRVSDHVAYALLVYTGLQIFVTMQALKSGEGGSIMPYFGLAFLIAAIIPGARWFESRWNAVSDERAHDPALLPAFRRDVAALWLCAIGLPFALCAASKGVIALV